MYLSLKIDDFHEKSNIIVIVDKLKVPYICKIKCIGPDETDRRIDYHDDFTSVFVFQTQNDSATCTMAL